MSGRTPLIVSTAENPIQTESLIEVIDKTNSVYHLRLLASHIPLSEWPYYRAEQLVILNEKLMDSKEAHVTLLLNDDKDVEWASHYDPHMDILFGKGGLPNNLW